MKLNRFGQATAMTKPHYQRVRKALRSDLHKLFLDLAWFTAERPTAILLLGVGDVYDLARRAPLPLSKITYRGVTRKMGDTRQVVIGSELKLRLRAHQPPGDGWLFPSLVKLDQHLSLRAMDRAFRRGLHRAGLDDLGYSLYSMRRGALTELHRRGFTLREIQAFSGHKSLVSLARYLEVSEEQIENMVEAL